MKECLFEQAWLNYAKNKYHCSVEVPGYIRAGHGNKQINNCVSELTDAFFSMTGKTLVCEEDDLGVIKNEPGIYLRIDDELSKEEYRIQEKDGNLYILGGDGSGVLYGGFELIRRVQLGELLSGLEIRKAPVMPLRMLNHWDNMDGSIERGYSGTSFFFEDNEVIVNKRTECYARLLASVGINAAVINNVNVKEQATWLITERYIDRVAQMADIFEGYGIRLYLSLNFAAPMELGGIDSADPLEAKVITWWEKKMEEVFQKVPNLGGFLIKADSEGRPGPFTYGRTHADGANMLAKIVARYDALIIWRCFVYNCQQDWRDYKTDRARAGYDNFISLDGSFEDNVILQIKNGPMDFQVREPIHPLFGSLNKTNQMLEVQIAQEYTGQQKHVCYLLPMFKEILNFHTYLVDAHGERVEKDTVCEIVSGQSLSQANCGIAAVANTGNDENWTGHDLAAANLYGFGRIAFEPELSAEEIAKEWITLTFGKDESVQKTLTDILMNSWEAYEKYTSPLGIGWMVNPGHHYGPNVDGYEYDRWGTYHRANHMGLGVDRSQAGTGYAKLYREPNASLYENVESCPEELLLFFHPVPYTYQLKTGKTVIQHIYDTHFEGVEMVDRMVEDFRKLNGKLPEKVYDRILKRLLHQQEHSREWRDRVNTYFYRMSGIKDEKGRIIY